MKSLWGCSLGNIWNLHLKFLYRCKRKLFNTFVVKLSYSGIFMNEVSQMDLSLLRLKISSMEKNIWMLRLVILVVVPYTAVINHFFLLNLFPQTLLCGITLGTLLLHAQSIACGNQFSIWHEKLFRTSLLDEE